MYASSMVLANHREDCWCAHPKSNLGNIKTMATKYVEEGPVSDVSTTLHRDDELFLEKVKEKGAPRDLGGEAVGPDTGVRGLGSNHHPRNNLRGPPHLYHDQNFP